MWIIGFFERASSVYVKEEGAIFIDLYAPPPLDMVLQANYVLVHHNSMTSVCRAYNAEIMPWEVNYLKEKGLGFDFFKEVSVTRIWVLQMVGLH